MSTVREPAVARRACPPELPIVHATRAMPSGPVLFVAALTAPPPETTENATVCPAIGLFDLSVTLIAIESAVSKPLAVAPTGFDACAIDAGGPALIVPGSL